MSDSGQGPGPGSGQGPEWLDEDWDEEPQQAPRPAGRGSRDTRGGGARPTPLGVGLVGAVVGAVIMAIVLVIVGGNPFSDANEIAYAEIMVATVSEEQDRLCWSNEPQRRDAPLECAVLALDPRVDVPREGDRILAGIVTLRTPGGLELQQIVFAGPPGGEAPQTESPSPTPGVTAPTPTDPTTDTVPTD